MAYSEWSREDGWSKKDVPKGVVVVGDGEEGESESDRERSEERLPSDYRPEIGSEEDLKITPVTPDVRINKDEEAMIRDAIIKGGLLDKRMPIVNDKDEIN